MIKSTRSRHKQINKIKELSNQQDQGTFNIPNVCDHAMLAKKRTTKQIPLVQAQLYIKYYKCKQIHPNPQDYYQ